MGGLSVMAAINKVTECYAMDYQSLKDLYYKHNSSFPAWERAFNRSRRKLNFKEILSIGVCSTIPAE